MFIKLPESMDDNTRADMRMFLNNLEFDKFLFNRSHSGGYSRSYSSGSSVKLTGKWAVIAGLIIANGILLAVKLYLPQILQLLHFLGIM